MERLTILRRRIISQGYYSENLKIVKGVVIRKRSKPNYSKPNAYRVISLINCISKVIKKVATVGLTRQLERITKLHKRQMGFREKRSTMDTQAEII